MRSTECPSSLFVRLSVCSFVCRVKFVICYMAALGSEQGLFVSSLIQLFD